MATLKRKFPTFIVYDIMDNWKDHLFESSRYLDTIAALLAIQKPCTAVAYYNNTFIVSYNSSPSEVTENILKDITTLLKQRKSNIELIPYYLLFNNDFQNALSNHVFHLQNPAEYGHVFNMLKAYIYNTSTVKFELENRCFTVQEVNDILKNKFTSIIPYTELDIINNSINKRLTEVSNTMKNKNKIMNKFTESYFDILKLLETIDDEQLRQIMIRPYQDTVKACGYFEKLVSPCKEIMFDILQNPRKIHAEVNIAKEYPFMLESNYIGISKLCCGACHNTLEQYKYKHRGSHGVIFPDDWIPPVRQLEDMIEHLHRSKKADVVTNDQVLRNLGRQLSTDDFETQFGEFYDLKRKLLVKNDNELSTTTKIIP
eukprot:gene12966-27369_t